MNGLGITLKYVNLEGILQSTLDIRDLEWPHMNDQLSWA